LEKNIYKNYGKVINDKIISHIRENNNENKFVLEVMSNSHYGDAIIYNSPILFNRNNFSIAIFSKVYYESLIYNLKLFGFSELKLKQVSAKTVNEIDTIIASLSKNKVKKLYASHKVKYLISKNTYSFMSPIVVENNYFLYDLENIE